MINCPCEKSWGVMLLGEADREAPAQAEPHPTCAGLDQTADIRGR
jgi:hypothetical protein